MNLYQWEAKVTSAFRDKGSATLSWLLIACAIVIVLIAVFARSPWFKALALAYIVLP